MDWRVRKVISLMNDNPHQKLTLNELARSVNLSPTRLHHLFKAELNDSPARYLKWLRMQQAKELLETTPLSVKEIAHRVGVKDASHFVRDFETACGLTPTRYRAHYLSTNDGKNEPEETRQQKPLINNRIG